MTVESSDQKIQYREFCKFFNKRFINKFKLVDYEEGDKDEENFKISDKKKSALE